MSVATKLALALGLTLAAAPPFQILTTHLPPPRPGEAYHAQLKAEGGTTPYTWRIVRGRLPAGLHFDARAGAITGTPTSDRAFSILVEARDASQPPMEVTRLLPASISAPLDLQWTKPPQVNGEKLAGAVEVLNHSGQTVQLTVIVVAVNEHNKAFTLRYAHPKLDDGQSSGALPFSVFLPPGSYTVHVDAVAEVSAQVIYRQRMEVPGLTVPGT